MSAMSASSMPQPTAAPLTAATTGTSVWSSASAAGVSRGATATGAVGLATAHDLADVVAGAEGRVGAGDHEAAAGGRAHGALELVVGLEAQRVADLRAVDGESSTSPCRRNLDVLVRHRFHPLFEPSVRRPQLACRHDRSDVDIVQQFSAAWVGGDLDVIIGFFADDAMYHNIPLAPVTGTDAIRATIEGFPGGVDSIEFRVLHIAANGAAVLTERIDVFRFPSATIELPVMGTFEVADGKITAWRDYFDLNQFMSQMPQG